MQAALDKGKERLEKAIAEYKPNRIFAGFSGGTDSLMATHFLHQLRSDVGTLHVNTGIGMKRTRQYVRDTSDKHGWDLEEYRATDYGYDYDEMVRGNVDGVPGGFPGPPLHYIYYGKLKEVPIQRAHRDHKGKRGVPLRGLRHGRRAALRTQARLSKVRGARDASAHHRSTR